jgi:hypothetical protein
MHSSTTSDPVILSSARWFWWIAALSLVNVVLFYSGSNTSFVVGLGMTSVAAAVFQGNIAVALAVVGLTLGFYFLMGLFAQREKAWAFYLGLALYALDALVYISVQDWMPVAFHAYAIYCIARGVLRLRQANQLPVAANDSI